MNWYQRAGATVPETASPQSTFGQASLAAHDGSTTLRRPDSPLSPPARIDSEWKHNIQKPENRVAQAVTEVTQVRLNSTEAGLEVVLETRTSTVLTPVARIEETVQITEIENAVLALPEGPAFEVVDPAPGVSRVSVTQVGTQTIQVKVVGTTSAPNATVTVAPPTDQTSEPEVNTAEEDELEITVTAERRENTRYRVPDASTATRTDTPLRDIPQAIQVIPKEVIQDQGVTRVEDALRNAVGVNQQPDRRSPAGSFTIRGFSSNGLRNGFDFEQSGDGRQTPLQLPNTLERIEVLRGPDSVLYGSGEPGGTVNYVTKEPLSNPAYSAELTVGSFGLVQPSVDLTGPLTEDQSLLYRFTAAYQRRDSFLDFVEGDAVSIAPSLSFQISEETDLKLEYEYSHYSEVPYSGLPLDPVIFDLPRSRNFNFSDRRRAGTNHALTLSLNHAFNDNLSVRSAFRANFFDARDNSFNLFDFDSDFNEIGINFAAGSIRTNTYSWQNSLTAKFKTGPISHQLLVGVDWTRENSADNATDFEDLFLDVFNPNFNQPFRTEEVFFFEREVNTDVVGLYIQDLIELLPNLKLLIGGRYDFLNFDEEGFEIFDGEREAFPANFNDQAFSPRVGLVYQPIEPVSLYANFNRSFSPNNARTRFGETIEPERGTQFEVGVKAEFGNLAANLAAYQITKTNVLRVDPVDDDFSIPIGEVRSRGIELDIGGEILPGWNIVASTFVNDSEITEGDEFNPGGDKRLCCMNQFWSTISSGASLYASSQTVSGLAM